MRRLVGLLAPLLLCACVTHPPIDAECAANAMCAARTAEALILASTNGRVERKQDELILHPRNAPPLHLTDDIASCAQADENNCVGYALMAAVPRSHTWVTQRFVYEGSDYLLIDSGTGRQTRLNGLPTFSPDGREFLVAPYDLESDTGPNDLEIWRRDEDGAVLDWAHRSNTSIEAPPPLIKVTGWQDDRIALEFQAPSDSSVRWSGTLRRTTRGWDLVLNAPKP